MQWICINRVGCISGAYKIKALFCKWDHSNLRLRSIWLQSKWELNSLKIYQTVHACIIEHTIYNILDTLFRVAFSFLLANYIPHLWGKQFRAHCMTASPTPARLLWQDTEEARRVEICNKINKESLALISWSPPPCLLCLVTNYWKCDTVYLCTCKFGYAYYMQGDQLAIVSQVYVTKMTLILVLISYNYVWWRGIETPLRRVVFSFIVSVSLVACWI